MAGCLVLLRRRALDRKDSCDAPAAHEVGVECGGCSRRARTAIELQPSSGRHSDQGGDGGNACCLLRLLVASWCIVCLKGSQVSGRGWHFILNAWGRRNLCPAHRGLGIVDAWALPAASCPHGVRVRGFNTTDGVVTAWARRDLHPHRRGLALANSRGSTCPSLRQHGHHTPQRLPSCH